MQALVVGMNLIVLRRGSLSWWQDLLRLPLRSGRCCLLLGVVLVERMRHDALDSVFRLELSPSGELFQLRPNVVSKKLRFGRRLAHLLGNRRQGLLESVVE